MTSTYDFTATAIDGSDQPLSAYAGKVTLVVNTASQCGLTPQYKGLQELYSAYSDRGFTILGFPCDQFGHQEPGTESEIASFCETSFGVTFPMFSKVDVNGADTHPLWVWLKSQRRGALSGAIKWNFTKFLVAPDGRVVKRYAPTTLPSTIAKDIEKLLTA